MSCNSLLMRESSEPVCFQHPCDVVYVCEVVCVCFHGPIMHWTALFEGFRETYCTSKSIKNPNDLCALV